ncbi:MAG: hypothetical protein ACRCXC_02655 [Legionella sp.]
MDRLLTAYRESQNKELLFDDNGEYAAIINEVKAYYMNLNCLESPSHIRVRDDQIENIGAFVRDYVLGKKNTVPEHLYAHTKNSWSAVFWVQCIVVRLRNKSNQK